MLFGTIYPASNLYSFLSTYWLVTFSLSRDIKYLFIYSSPQIEGYHGRQGRTWAEHSKFWDISNKIPERKKKESHTSTGVILFILLFLKEVNSSIAGAFFLFT